MSSIEIRPLPAAASSDDGVMADITRLVNQVYAESEKGLWRDGAERTTKAELAALTLAGEIVVARLGGRLAGSVRVQRLDEVTGEFGMLAADPAHRGTGVGRELVRYAERSCRQDGLAVMQLELLVPREWSHPSKEFLAAWYERMGYRQVRVGAFEEDFPQLNPLLATPCDYRIYHKSLVLP
ncbi:GNAT family N-acetyltransferase [Microtetraspora sp. NBRC 13810]|uniref:GNAT family N-acetyltransferase n=1 Tax=Microtetraspora sp. NBRC 13810 TaxID=3030990 RepID=UPI0024A1BB4F|nr:GNAT family N-acetyltransferase [Microtetraspora sp. NBRC 13810]GLW06435.1 GNAT family N-acetyltransferase [Microtetraspora sp. NBRC 13810]